MTRIEVDQLKCIHCGQCVDACFVNAIEWDEAKDEPFMKYGDDCQVCGVCETVCPKEALLVVPDWQAKHNPRLLACGGDHHG